MQGPPGTGKTSTIVNAIANAFCNGKTVLFASYNNHPVDGVFQSLTSLTYGDLTIPFPVLRLVNKDRVGSALEYMRDLYERTKDLPVPRGKPRLGDKSGAERAQTLTALLKEYEKQIELIERRDSIQTLADSSDNLNFAIELQSKQLAQVNKQLEDMQHLDGLFARARKLTDGDRDALLQFILGASLYRIQLLGKPRYAELLEMATSDDPIEQRADRFNKYVSDPTNLKALQRIFPVIATTCISARTLGPPEPSFDVTIIDEASQCDTATALVPILRGKSLVLSW